MFFFCKQKTAYEMRISDWSSDVCSSDRAALHAVEVEVRLVVDAPELIGDERAVDVGMERRVGVHVHDRRHGAVVGDEVARLDTQHAFLELPIAPHRHVVVQHAVTARSEEHTSELQSLMRISYAVFCLKKKKIK